MKYTDTNRVRAAKFPGARLRPSSRPTWIARRRWDKLATIPRALRCAPTTNVWKRHAAFAGTTKRIRRARLSVLPELFQRRRDRTVARRRGSHPETRQPGSMAREDRRAGPRLCGAHVQRDLPPARRP